MDPEPKGDKMTIRIVKQLANFLNAQVLPADEGFTLRSEIVDLEVEAWDSSNGPYATETITVSDAETGVEYWEGSAVEWEVEDCLQAIASFNLMGEILEFVHPDSVGVSASDFSMKSAKGAKVLRTNYCAERSFCYTDDPQVGRAVIDARLAGKDLVMIVRPS